MPYIIRNGKIIKVGAAKRTVKHRAIKRRVVPKQKRRVTKRGTGQTWKEKRHNWFVSKKAQYRVSSRDALAKAVAADPHASAREKRWADRVISGVRGQRSRTTHKKWSDSHLDALYRVLREAKAKLSVTSDPQKKAEIIQEIEGIRSAIWEYRGESRYG